MATQTTLADRGQWVLALVIVVVWAVVVFYGSVGSWPADLSAIYIAGHFYGQGSLDLVYASPERFFGSDIPPQWLAFRDQWTTPDNSVFPFVYPPIWAALMAPVTAVLTPFQFFNAVYAIQITMMAASIFLAYRIAGTPMQVLFWTILSVAILWTSLITAAALLHNQPQITVAFLMVLAFERYDKGKSGLAGGLLALAAAIKLAPVILVLVFFIDRNWRSIGVFLLTGGLLALASIALTGPALHWEFLSKLALINEQIAVMRINWALEAVIYEVWTWATGARPTLGVEDVQMPVWEPAWITALTRACLIAGLIWIFVQGRTGINARLVPVKIALIVTLTGPIAWSHHYIFCLFFLPALFTIWHQRRAAILVMLIALASCVPVFTWLNYSVQSIHMTMLAGVASMVLFFMAIMLAANR